MKLESIIKALREKLYEEWRNKTSVLLDYEKENKLNHAFLVRNELSGYLKALADVALSLKDDDLHEDCWTLNTVLIFIHSRQ